MADKPRYRVKAGSSALVAKAVEGEVRPGPYYLPVTGGWLPAGADWNWWQEGIVPANGYESSAMVEACLSAYSQTVAMCPGDHWKANDKGGRDRITSSALSRILRKPNAYQSPSDFMLNATRSLYSDGNGYALALRNDRYEIDELHLMDPRLSYPQVAVNGDVFYALGGNSVIDRQLNGEQLVVPQRDVLHIRLNATRRRYPFPLVGDTPLGAAMQDLALSNAMTAQQIQFYMNQARPSAVLTTDLILDKDQVQFVRDRWDEQSRGLKAGGTPILTGGLKPMMLAPANDIDLAKMMQLPDQHIALAFRIPPGILGISSAGVGSTEALMMQWIASGLGFALNHIEDAYGLLFNLKGQPDEYLELDTKALLRSAFKERIAGLVQAVQGGVFAPNEARNSEDLPSVKFGDEPRVQQQVVPLSAAAGIPSAPASPGSPPQPGQPALPKPPAKPPEPPTSAKDYNDVVAFELRNLLARADYHDRSNA